MTTNTGYRTIKASIEGPRADVVLDRPEARNAINMDMAKELLHAFLAFRNKEGLRVVVISGATEDGKEPWKGTFCAGGDLKWMTSQPEPKKALWALSDAIHKFTLEMHSLPVPVIAKVNGNAVGAGLGLVLSCDMSVAAATARFNTGFVNVGLAPGHGTYYLPRAVGRQRAFEMMVCSDNIPATTAMEIGLINRVVAPEFLESTVNGLVEKVLAAPPFAIAKIKELLNASQDSDLRTHFELEADAISSSAGTEDFKEGTDAFFNKRRPKFKGK